MILSPTPQNESERISELKNYQILDSQNETIYNEIVELASFICNTPIAYISLVDSERQWFKSKIGIAENETPRDISFCGHAINQNEIFIVNDALKDERFFDNPLVTDDPKIRFYAGAQLTTKNGYNIGTLCAVDKEPRNLNVNQINALKILAKQVVSNFELRKLNNELSIETNHLIKLNKDKDNLLKVISHDLRSPFNSILGFSEILQEDIENLSKEEIKEIAISLSNSAKSTYDLVNNILSWSLLHHKREIQITQKIKIADLIDKILLVLNGLLIKKDLTVSKKLDNDCILKTDYNVLYSILLNIVSNAIKYTEKAGIIFIKTSCEKTNVIISVSDSGIGMSQVKINNALNNNDDNFEVNNNNVKGVGFSIINEFVEKLQGSLSINSDPGKGTTVTVNFPIFV